MSENGKLTHKKVRPTQVEANQSGEEKVIIACAEDGTYGELAVVIPKAQNSKLPKDAAKITPHLGIIAVR